MQSSQASSSETLDVSRSPQPLGAHGLDQEKAAPAQTDVPDGGLKAWMTVAGSWLILFCTFGYLNAFGVFEDYYARDYLTSKTTSVVSWIGSTQLCLLFMMGLVSGKLFDLGYFHWCIGIGSLIYVFCLFMLSLAHKNEYYQVFLPQAIGLGLSQGLLFLPSVGVISHHFKKRRSLAMGIVLTGSSCGGIIFPVMLNNIIKQSGFGWGVRATAFVVLGCLVAANLMMKTRLPPKADRAPPPPPDIRGIVTHGVFQLTVAGSFLIMLGIWFPIFYVQLFAIVHDIDANLAFYSLAILNASSIFGRTIPNLLADKFGIFNVIIPCSAIVGVLVFAMFGVKSAGALIVFSILYGFFSGAFVSLISPMFVALARHMHEVGARLGLGFAVVGIATLIGTPISGALLTDENLWYRPIVFAGS
ncbi:major facilitator superfamily transporter [Ceratobasidium sp. AG-Ba]|nr:major facilitator superfamily transporter [Ceratobasidium sp. AG-Ba]QRW14050.1 major facilitator superfamily transporter [Ceratobasidium sp. AG-Ba]